MGKITVLHDVSGIQGLSVIVPRIIEDNRGYFTETYNEKDLYAEGIVSTFVQDNEAYSKKGVLRGIHVNWKHPQAKLIRVLEGEIYDVVIDLRENSRTYKKWYGIRLSAENRKQLFIPEGFGHGYLSLVNARTLFKATTHWIAGDETGFAWNSKGFNINWPINNPILSENDMNNPDFSELDCRRDMK